MGKSDATGHKRGAGEYSRSYPTLAQPKINPNTAREIYGALDEVGYRNDGYAAPVSKGSRTQGK